jgi:hypothetical protein
MEITMFGLEYILAFVKVAFQVGFAIVTAIPFVFAWNCIAPKYLAFIPSVYQHLPYWHIVGLLIVTTIIGEQIGKITPKFINISQNNSSK